LPLCFFLLFSMASVGQTSHCSVLVMDTIWFEGEQIVRYTDYSWEYLSDIKVDTITAELAKEIYAKIDTAALFSYRWHTGKTYSRDINLKHMTDTVELNLLSELDPNVFLPQVGSVTSPFGPRWGKMHKGVDINLNTGDQVHCAFAGKVRYARYNQGGYGNLVIVRHFNGLETYYAHLSRIDVKSGQLVKAGATLGKGGSTGHSTGPHLHFEVRYFDNALDPQMIFNFKYQKLKTTTLLIHTGSFGYSEPMETKKIVTSKSQIVPVDRKKRTPIEVSRA
ncbi:MAG: murein DD-endopeptidase MepM/ murein hydrolase activator NlpD, partial [Parvicellaceae bacterium]